jgi:hypothetical protein
MALAVGVASGRRCGRAERVGLLSLVGTAIELNDEKIRETGGPLALDGRRLAG